MSSPRETAELKTDGLGDVALNALRAHPENPRLVVRDDVVNRIAAEIRRGGFDPAHAILATPGENGSFVIVSGHHRVEAARRAGLTVIPGWVRVLGEAEQWRLLVTSNDQSELDPVERARHFHAHVQRYGGPGEPGRGQEGGINLAARELGYSRVTAQRYYTVGRLVAARENGQELAIFSDGGLLGRMEGLHEVAQAPVEAWAPLTAALIREKWRVSDARNRARTAREVVDAIPARHRSWLDPQATVSRWLAAGEPTPRAVAALVSEVERCEETVCEHTPGEVEAFRAWLAERGAELGRLEVMDRRHQVEQAATAANPKAKKPDRQPARGDDDEPEKPRGANNGNTAADTGDATGGDTGGEGERDGATGAVDGQDRDVDDQDEEEDGDGDGGEEVRERQEEERARATGSDLDLRVCACRDLTVREPVDAIVCDPPYPAEHLDCYTELAGLVARALRPGGSLLAMCGQSHLPDVLARLTATDGLTYQWTIAYLTPGGQAVQLWQRKVNTFYKPVIWMVAGVYDGPWMSDVARSEVNDNDKRYHHWGQSESGMADLISRVTGPGDLVCDPFLGGGTTGRVALALGRRFVGGDIDPGVVDVARRRIAEARDADAARGGAR